MAAVIPIENKHRTLHIILLVTLIVIGIGLHENWTMFRTQTIIVDCISLFIATLVFINLLRVIQQYYHAQKALNATNIALVVLLISLTVLINYSMVLMFRSESDQDFEGYLIYTSYFRIAVIALIYFMALLLFWMDQQRIHEKKLKEFAVEKERENVKIEMNSIQQQFKPHFLFNSLNSINALTITNPEEARKMIQLLSEFMRGSVKQDQDALIPLKDEIHHLKLYTDIEKVRFGKRLSVNYEVPESLMEVMVPPLILQPLIENAIKYGLYGNTGNVTIDIKALEENKYLVLVITNPYDEITQRTSKGTGFGLRSIERKMLLIFGQSNLLTSSKTESTFTTQLKIPMP